MKARASHLAGMLPVAAVFLLAALASGRARAQTPVCDALGTDDQDRIRVIFEALHPYDGCDDTFAVCLKKKPASPIVLRLASDICRLVKAGKGKKDIERGMMKRAQSLMPTSRKAAIAVDETMGAGESGAPVKAVIYACARCPFCKVLVPAVYKEVEEGTLKGKVSLHFRPFPIKSHPGSIEGGLAMFAAAYQGKFWSCLLDIYKRYDAFSPDRLPDWAAALGLNRARFEKDMADPRTREALVASKQEGIRNTVDATPTLFINGRKYVYEMSVEAVLDVLHEAWEGTQGP